MLEVFLQSKIQIYYAEYTSQKDQKIIVTKPAVCNNSLYIRQSYR